MCAAYEWFVCETNKQKIAHTHNWNKNRLNCMFRLVWKAWFFFESKQQEKHTQINKFKKEHLRKCQIEIWYYYHLDHLIYAVSKTCVCQLFQPFQNWNWEHNVERPHLFFFLFFCCASFCTFYNIHIDKIDVFGQNVYMQMMIAYVSDATTQYTVLNTHFFVVGIFW